MGRMKHAGSRVIYRVRFPGHPELDSDSFESQVALSVGDELDYPEIPLGENRFPLGENRFWLVRQIIDAENGESDVVICDLAVRA
jgi:hypothetical protein